MRRGTSTAAAAVAAFVIVTLAEPAIAAKKFDSHQDGASTVIAAEERRVSTAKVQAVRGWYRVHLFLPACRGNDPNSAASLDTSCAGALQMCASTPDPADLMFWRFTATRTPAGRGGRATLSAWTQAGMLCLRRDRVPGSAVPAFTATDLARLPLPATPVHIQPGTARVLVQKPTNLYTTAAPATFHVRLLGVPVTVRATPASWIWTYGDHSTVTHTRPGGPYPDLGTAHTYTRPGSYTVTLTTSWTGTYTLPGGTPLPIDGTATVPSTPITLTAVETRAQLVADTLP